MKTYQRVTLELLGPSVISGIIVSAYSWHGAGAAVHLKDVLSGLLLFPLFALIGCGIQSVIFTAILEVAYKNGLPRRSGWTIFVAGFLGLLSGLSIPLAYAHRIEFPALGFWGVFGLIVGSCIGSAIYLSEDRVKKMPNQSLEPMARSVMPRAGARVTPALAMAHH